MTTDWPARLILLILAIGIPLLLAKGDRSAARTPPRDVEEALRSKGRHQADEGFSLTSRLNDLQEYVRIGSQVFTVDALKLPPIHEVPPSTDRLAFARSLVVLTVLRFGMQVPSATVAFAPLGGTHAGRANRDTRGNWSSTVDHDYREDDEGLMTIIAHEVAHVALLGRGVRIEPTLRNEELTDVTAVLAGFGPLMLRTVLRERVVETNQTLTVHTKRLGYLPPRALVYLSALRVEMAGGDAERFRNQVPHWQRAGVEAYIAMRDMWCVRASASRGAVTRCFGCGTSLKIPSEPRAFAVTCRTCRVRAVVPKKSTPSAM